MAFDWIRFFEQHRIEYATSGPAVSRDNVAIHCPFCGPPYERMRLSVNLEGRGFRCFVRQQEHRGKNPTRLVQAILGCTYERAAQITGQSLHVPDDFAARVRAAINPTPPKAPPPLKLPPEFKTIGRLPSSKPYVRYLRSEERGFTERQIETLTKRYDVRYCTTGSYHGRIVFPIYYRDQLVSWTGRAIDKDAFLRYKALSVDEEKAGKEGYKPAVGAISHFLLWYDDIKEEDADTICLCEGPFDALKVRVLGRRYGVTATCFFTMTPTEPQVDLLHELLPRFKRRLLLLDAGTFATSLRVASGLSTLGVIPHQLPASLKDPGRFGLSTFDEFLLTLR